MNAEIFRWARETSGWSLDRAAKALGIKNVARLQEIETGLKEPSSALLLRMAKQYRRPLVTFYLAGPPEKGNRGQDFRTLPGDRSTADDALLDALIRDVQARQEVIRSLVEDDDDAERLRFVGANRMSDGVSTVLKSIMSTIGIELGAYRREKSSEKAFAYLRKSAESAGIFVLLMGNLGSHHSNISVETFRGFAIADAFAPFVVINDQDARTAWSFTLLHELAHLWLGITGVSGADAEQDVERFCNDVASRFLLLDGEIDQLRISDSTPFATALPLLGRFAGERNLSRKMLAYRLFRADKVSRATWKRLDRALSEIRRTERAAEKEESNSEDPSSGPSYYVVRRHRLGGALLSLVGQSMEAGSLTPVKAARVLGVKPRSVYPLLMNRDRFSSMGAQS